MSIEVLKPGLMTTVQDLGRAGFQKYGVLVSGAMDADSLRIANLLAGNSQNEAALEVTLMGPGPSLRFQKPALIAVTGADFSLMVNDEEVPLWRPVFIKEGSVLTFGMCKRGSRAYMAVAGGIDVPPVMESKSTYVRAGLGGFQGEGASKGRRVIARQPDAVVGSAAQKARRRGQRTGLCGSEVGCRPQIFSPAKKEPGHSCHQRRSVCLLYLIITRTLFRGSIPGDGQIRPDGVPSSRRGARTHSASGNDL